LIAYGVHWNRAHLFSLLFGICIIQVVASVYGVIPVQSVYEKKSTDTNKALQ